MIMNDKRTQNKHWTLSTIVCYIKSSQAISSFVKTIWFVLDFFREFEKIRLEKLSMWSDKQYHTLRSLSIFLAPNLSMHKTWYIAWLKIFLLSYCGDKSLFCVLNDLELVKEVHNFWLGEKNLILLRWFYHVILGNIILLFAAMRSERFRLKSF